MYHGVPMRTVTRSIRIWAYSNVDDVSQRAWSALCQYGGSNELVSAARIRRDFGDEVAEMCHGGFVSWSRSDGWICHTRFNVSIQGSSGFLGGLGATVAAVRAHPEGSQTSSLRIQCTLTSHIGDTKLSERAERPVLLAAGLFGAALDDCEIEYRFD